MVGKNSIVYAMLRGIAEKNPASCAIGVNRSRKAGLSTFVKEATT